MDSESISRRSFIGKVALIAGFMALTATNLSGQSPESRASQSGLPREVWIATVSQQGMNIETPEKTVQSIFAILEKCVAYRPDVICLPEVFMYNYLAPEMDLKKEAARSAELLKEFMNFARKNHCYMICPVVTHENGKIYNAAVVLDRQGNRMGEYRKMYLPDDEVKLGLTPGPSQPPVFKADFGIFGIQICYDISWNQGWKALRQQGAEIIFWPSAFPGGQMVNAMAWQHNCVVVSSNRERSKICDISGEVIAQTGVMGDLNYICAPVNLEKAFVHAWPNMLRFDEIRAKYGRKVRITTHHEEQWSIIESLSPDVRVKDILTEFNMRTFEQQMLDSDKANNLIRLK
jgi:predicted amidohydrolase